MHTIIYIYIYLFVYFLCIVQNVWLPQMYHFLTCVNYIDQGWVYYKEIAIVIALHDTKCQPFPLLSCFSVAVCLRYLYHLNLSVTHTHTHTHTHTYVYISLSIYIYVFCLECVSKIRSVLSIICHVICCAWNNSTRCMSYCIHINHICIHIPYMIQIPRSRVNRGSRSHGVIHATEIKRISKEKLRWSVQYRNRWNVLYTVNLTFNSPSVMVFGISDWLNCYS